MSPREVLQGFDVREQWTVYPTSWPTTRQQTFLLRHDVVKPLSTDTLVWESVLDLVDDAGDPLMRNNPEAWQPLWTQRDAMCASIDHVWGADWRPSWIIAMTACVESVAQEKAMHLGFCEGWGLPTEIDPQWQLLGYDVSDAGYLSGLSNCGYTASEQAELASRWGPLLNRYHLFSELSHALAFKTLTDARVPEHAPFAVFGLYLIERRGVA